MHEKTQRKPRKYKKNKTKRKHKRKPDNRLVTKEKEN